MMNQVYNPVTAEIKQFPRINNDDCIFCYGRGFVASLTGSADCQACWGTGKDDVELFLIMSGRLIPPADGCGTTILEG